MSLKPLDDEELAARLRDGLRRLHVPTPSADFDANVLAALAHPQRWWQTLWQRASPLLAGAACSLVLTLAAVWWTTQTPLAAPHQGSPLSITATSRPLDMASFDRLLAKPNLSAASLFHWEAPSANMPTPDRRPPLLIRRASRLPVSLLA